MPVVALIYTRHLHSFGNIMWGLQEAFIYSEEVIGNLTYYIGSQCYLLVSKVLVDTLLRYLNTSLESEYELVTLKLPSRSIRINRYL